MPDLSRREFLTRSWQRSRRAHLRWLRPPFALDEAAFTAACTRCGACIEACPKGVIFALGEALGGDLAGTPALSLVQRGCALCDDAPCAAACETGALHRETGEDGRPAPFPPLALCRIARESCIAFQGPECGACASLCPVPGALVLEGGTRPAIDPERCLGCALCREACVTEPKSITIHPPEPPENAG